MKVVIDTSVVVKWLIPSSEELYTDQALELLEAIRTSRVTALQPPHWLAESAAVIARLDSATAPRAVDLLAAMQLPVIDELEVYQRAVTLATRLRHHLFDTLYHAVALEHDATLITAEDRKSVV